MHISPALLALLLAGGVAACGKDDSSDSSAAKSRFKVVIGESAALAPADKADGTTETESDDNEDAAGVCKGFLGATAEVATVTGSGQTVELSPKDAMVIKVAGNKNVVSVTLEPETKTETSTATGSSLTEETTTTTTMPAQASDRPTLAGVCFRLSGNQAKAKLAIKGVVLGKLGFIGRGNQPSVAYELGDDSKVDEFLWDVKGNKGTSTITGTGEFTCPTASEGLTCTKTEKTDATTTTTTLPESTTTTTLPPSP